MRRILFTSSVPFPDCLQKRPLVQNDPNQSTKPMRDCSDGLPVSQARHQPAIHDLEDASFVLDRGISRLIEDPSHVTVTRGAAGALVGPRALFVSRTRAHP